jgi:EmrB/QacA subfamily drug resistance transporter
VTGGERPAEAKPPSVGETPAPISTIDRKAMIVVVSLMMGLLMGALDGTIVLTALGQILKDLNGQSAAETTFVVAAYLIAQTIALPIFGKLSDSYGRRRFFLLGLVVFLIGSALSGISQTTNELIVFRAVQGVGAGAFFPVAMSIIGVMFTPEARARLTGVFASVFGIASVIGPFVGSYIVDNLSWRWVFYVNIPIGVIALAMIVAYLPPLRATVKPKPFDTVGSVLLAAWVGPLVFVLQEVSAPAGAAWAWTDPRVLGLLAASAALFVGFLLQELRSADPLVPLRYFQQRVILIGSAISLLRGVVLLGVSVFVTVFVDIQLNNGPTSADAVRNVLYGFVLPLVFGSIVGGRLLLRFPYRPIMVSAMALMTFGMFVLSTATLATPTWGWTAAGGPTGLGVFLIPVGFGVGMSFSAVILSVQYAVPVREIGTATSLIQFLGSLGGSIGIPVLTAYYTARFSALTQGGPPAGTASPLGWFQANGVESVHSVFLVMAGVALAAAVLAVLVSGALPRDKPKEAHVVPPAAEPA